MANRGRIAWQGVGVVGASDADRARIAWQGVLVVSPLENRGWIAWQGAQVVHASDVNRARVGWLGVYVVHSDDTAEAALVPSAECDCGPGTWLLDIEVGGLVCRYSTRRLEVVDVDGRELVYEAGLTDLSLRIDGLQESQGIEVIDQRIDWALLANRGDQLHLATATLRYWSPGEAFEQAPIVLQGRLDEPEYGKPDRPAAIVGTIDASGGDILWPDPRAVVSAETWRHDAGVTPTLGVIHMDTDIRGAVYPTVFGYPGDDGSGGDPAPCTPALMVETEFLFGSSYRALFLISEGAVDATDVLLFGPTGTGGTSTDVLPVAQKTDLLGRTISYTEHPAASSELSADPTAGQEWWIGWSRATGGGIRLPDGSGPVRDLVDVAIWVLTGSGRRVDLQAQEAQRDLLSAFHIDAFVNAELQLIPWFESTFLPLFPLARARTQHGMYWRRLDYGAGPERAVHVLDVDEVGSRYRRTSSIKTELDAVRNLFRIDYGFDVGSGFYQLRRVLSAEDEKVQPWYLTPDHLDDVRVVGSAICASSQTTFGVIEDTPIETKLVWNTATATAILRARAQRDAFPRRVVTYTGPSRELRHLTRGDAVLLTDAEVRFSEEVALVRSVTIGSGSLATIEVEVLDRRVRG